MVASPVHESPQLCTRDEVLKERLAKELRGGRGHTESRANHVALVQRLLERIRPSVDELPVPSEFSARPDVISHPIRHRAADTAGVVEFPVALPSSHNIGD
jgi:hypothetical protein